MSTQNYAIGIDLGTTYSCVGVYRDGCVEIIANDQGNRTTPSWVAFTSDGERLVGDAAKSQATERQKRVYFDAGRIQITPYLAGAVQTFDRECEISPGITALPSTGHTPGHSCYILRSEDEAMIIWGDTVHVPEVQLAYPDVGMIFDTDTPAAARSRRKILQRCVDENLLVAGMHIHFPGFARIRPGYAGEYRFIPEQWYHAVKHGQRV